MNNDIEDIEDEIEDDDADTGMTDDDNADSVYDQRK